MSKRKDKEKNEVTEVVGTPTMMLLPARNYKFKVHTKNYTITIPKKGSYVDFDNELFSEEDGNFDIMVSSGQKKTLLVPEISRVLFAASTYPDLKDNQAFTPLAVIVTKDKVSIMGNIIEMVDIKKGKK